MLIRALSIQAKICNKDIIKSHFSEYDILYYLYNSADLQRSFKDYFWAGLLRYKRIK